MYVKTRSEEKAIFTNNEANKGSFPKWKVVNKASPKQNNHNNRHKHGKQRVISNYSWG